MIPSLAMCAVAFAPGCGAPVPTCPCGPCEGTVARVVDGDTVELASGEKVRYLMVDTPETTSGKMDCYGKEAVEFNKQLVDGQRVSLRYDEAACHDRYQRLLAYLSVGGIEVNTLLVARGYACVLYLPPAGKSREIEFKTIQAAAKTNKVGVWGACNPVTCEQ